ncbi:MAG: iron-sulfur cluster repair protein YtfE [Thermogutta sp.]|uniref:iron-sulfur cluster repair protein YtfE n=1 Tax=Thermogutta sp. TaxID=1962930 RepID=UPI0019B9C504|nr:iron-sulfur cluster repair protein YtfE [Thermogutta sp.]MBC7351244.1 iron-sulfur cluster repair protein YtfE [Thermogutta sp.]
MSEEAIQRTFQRTLGELVTAKPAAAKVFHRYGLDFCCGGNRSLAAACAEAGINAETVAQEIERLASDGPDPIGWNTRPLKELVEHILQCYHAPLKEEIPRLIDLARKVEQVHADKPDCPVGLAELLVCVREAVESHLAKEEQILFPMIVAGRGQMAHMPVQVMMQEHEDHGQNLKRIRELTNDLTIPEYACTAWRELYRSLEQLECDLMAHIHLENNILFPRALTEEPEKGIE